jgi:hypothetical protein
MAAVLFCASLATPPASAGTQTYGEYQQGGYWDTSYRGQHHVSVDWWNYFDRDPNNRKNQVHISVDAGDLAAGKCVQAAFDWHNGLGHYDPRIVRVCKDFGHRETSVPWYDEPNICPGPQGYCVLAMHQVQFAIYDVSTGTLSNPECVSSGGMGGPTVDRVCGGPTWDPTGDRHDFFHPDPTNTCADTPNALGFRMWIRRADGTTDLCPGGDPMDFQGKQHRPQPRR